MPDTKIPELLQQLDPKQLPRRRSRALKVTEHIAKADSTLFSIEVLPPMKGKTIQDLFKVLDPLMEFKPPFVDVTYHREEILYKKL